jgi:biotin transport system substrate-specific component
MENAIYKSNITLIDKVFPWSHSARTAVLVVAGALLTAIGAQIEIPWYPVPFTLQPLAVLLCGLVLGSKKGALSQLSYLAMGSVGLPVFAGGAFGFAKLLGPTGGYLCGFVVAAYVLGLLAEQEWDRKPFKLFGAMLIGNAIILGLGTFWLSKYFGMEVAVQKGLLPFISCDIVKDVIVALMLPTAWRFVNAVK